MDDEQIEALRLAMASGPVYWVYDGQIKHCVSIVLDWIQRYSDGSFATTAEPAVFFPDGTCAALWLCDVSQFVRLTDALTEYE
jgi:hypothetical protein